MTTEISESFTVFDNLEPERTADSGEKQFKRHLCDKCFSQTGHLGRHKTTHRE